MNRNAFRVHIEKYIPRATTLTFYQMHSDIAHLYTNTTCIVGDPVSFPNHAFLYYAGDDVWFGFFYIYQFGHSSGPTTAMNTRRVKLHILYRYMYLYN